MVKGPWKGPSVADSSVAWQIYHSGIRPALWLRTQALFDHVKSYDRKGRSTFSRHALKRALDAEAALVLVVVRLKRGQAPGAEHSIRSEANRPCLV
jgi:hypothetical protein